MIQQLEFAARGLGETQNSKLRRYLEARPGRWIPMPELAEAIGAYAVHSRVADLRKLGMDIRHRSRRSGRLNLSDYQYLPPRAEENDCPNEPFMS